MRSAKRLGVRRLAAAFVLVALACSDHVSRDRWQHMNASEKTLYVSSLLGGERAKQAKNGGGRVYNAPAETYVARIDEAYARGDRRDPSVIFAELADRR